MDEKGCAAGDIGGGERVKEKKIGDPRKGFAGGAEGAARHGNEIHFSGKCEVDVKEEERCDKEEKPANAKEEEGGEKAAEGGDHWKREHAGACGCA